MKKHFLITIAIAILFMLNTNCVKAQTFNPQLASMLQDSLNFYVSAITNIKGMSASVYIPGQGTWQGTAGVSYSGHPITADMGFGIASNTKLFVAAAMLILAENNIISLHDSLHKWLPSYPNINPNITIRQLLNHTSGVQDPIFLPPWMDTIKNNSTRVFTPEEVLGWVGTPLFAPGTNWSYSNINYILAGMVAQSASGFHISEIIRDSILTPLNLNSTFYDVEEPEVGTVAHRWYNTIDYSDTSRVGLNTAGGAAGSLFSTTADMAKWYHTLLSGQVLSPASFAELTNFVSTPTSYTYGLGLENQAYFGHTTWGHGGSTWGYKSRMLYEPCMGAVVCGLANSWPAGMDGVTLILFRIVVNHIPGCGATITGPVTVCQGANNVIYSVAPIANATTYIWTLPGGATGTSSTNSITVNYGGNAVSGNITVKGANLYGEGMVSSLQVIVNTAPGTVTVNGGGTFCNTATLTASGGGGGTIYWQGTTNNGTSMATPSGSQTVSSSGTYYFRSYNGNCGWGNQGSTTVTINSLPNATVTPAGSTSFCSGGSVVLHAPVNSNRTYQWKKGANLIPGATLSSYTATTAGNYKVIVTNTVTGCSKTTANATVVTVYSNPAATITPQGPTTFCSGGSVVLQANTGSGLSYKWKKNNNLINGVTLSSYSATTAGTYKVQVINSHGCSKTSSGIVVTVNCRLSDENAGIANMQIFPNPANGMVTLKFISKENQNYELIVTDMEGRELIHEPIMASAGINENNIQMGNFVNGVYLVKLKTRDYEINEKIFKE